MSCDKFADAVKRILKDFYVSRDYDKFIRFCYHTVRIKNPVIIAAFILIYFENVPIIKKRFASTYGISRVGLILELKSLRKKLLRYIRSKR